MSQSHTCFYLTQLLPNIYLIVVSLALIYGAPPPQIVSRKNFSKKIVRRIKESHPLRRKPQILFT